MSKAYVVEFQLSDGDSCLRRVFEIQSGFKGCYCISKDKNKYEFYFYPCSVSEASNFLGRLFSDNIKGLEKLELIAPTD